MIFLPGEDEEIESVMKDDPCIVYVSLMSSIIPEPNTRGTYIQTSFR